MNEVTRAVLRADLRRLGVREGDCVMLHSSLSSLGRVEGGAEAVVEAFLDATGPEGTLITPAFTEGAWKEHLAMPDCQDWRGREFCRSQWPSHQGAIPNAGLETGRAVAELPSPRIPGLPTGLGRKRVLREHRHCPTFCGRGNPFEKLVEFDGLHSLPWAWASSRLPSGTISKTF